ncbi:MAG: 2-phosphosulfolactate phosphatase [Planctomycetaceae bacterium]|nr:2-phosphosulfolactate phosphatase [Planctomycetaceae bacterium]
MTKIVNVFLLPTEVGVEREFFGGSCAVVIDILRSTTTLAYAAASGLREIIPVLTVDDALRMRSFLSGEIIVGGERNGEKINGFDVGNSPAEMTAEIVKNKKLIFTSTNGTRAMLTAKKAAKVLLGSFVNAGVLCSRLLSEERVILICSGTDGQVTSEDVLFAGLVASKLAFLDNNVTLDKTAESCLDKWNRQSRKNSLLEILRMSDGAKNLLQLGMDKDIEDAANCDSIAVVPEIYFDKINYSILGENAEKNYT